MCVWHFPGTLDLLILKTLALEASFAAGRPPSGGRKRRRTGGSRTLGLPPGRKTCGYGVVLVAALAGTSKTHRVAPWSGELCISGASIVYERAWPPPALTTVAMYSRSFTE